MGNTSLGTQALVGTGTYFNELNSVSNIFPRGGEIDVWGNLITFDGGVIGGSFLGVLDTTDGSNALKFRETSDLTADRNLDFVTGDASRVMTITGDTTLDNWFDQNVKTTAFPLFAGLGIGTTTPTINSVVTIASSTVPQLSLFGGTGINGWAMRNAGGDLFFSTTTVAGTATTSTSALTIKGNGKPGLAISSSTPFATLAVDSTATNFSNLFAIGSPTKTSLILTNAGWFGYGTSSPDSQFTIQGDGSGDVFDIDLSNGNHAVQFMSNGKAGFGTSTPWGQFSILALSDFNNVNPLVSIATSSTPYGQAINVFASSSAKSFGGKFEGQFTGIKIAFGAIKKYFSNFFFNGTASSWESLECDSFKIMLT
jgi:hypothetical protein